MPIRESFHRLFSGQQDGSVLAPTQPTVTRSADTFLAMGKDRPISSDSLRARAAGVGFPINRPFARRFFAYLRTAAAVFCAALSTLAAVAFTEQARYSETPSLLVIGSMAVGWAVAASLVWRQTRAVPIAIASSVAAIVLPLDTIAALIALPWVIAKQKVSTVVWTTAAVGLGTAAIQYRDVSRDITHRAFQPINPNTGARESIGFAGYLGVWLVALGIPILIGRRRCRKLRAATHAETIAAQARHEEREKVAVAVHDVVGPHLASVALQASALEVTQEDAEVKAAARQVRSAARKAGEGLSSLVSALRSDESSQTSFDESVRLINELRSSGVKINSFVQILELPNSGTIRVVNQLVKESLTNAMKHSPGAPIDVDLRVDRNNGVGLRISNPLLPNAPPGFGSGLGISTMRSRVAALGGDLRTGEEGNEFVVKARLPW